MDARLKLGFDNYALRSHGWKARQFLDYAAALKLDVIFFSDLDGFEDLSESGLHELRARAADLGLELYVGALSVCPSSVIFKPQSGTAEEQLRETIRVAKALGSPVARCVLGNVKDRRSPGGIEARIAETVQVLKNVRSQSLDAGVKIAVENHAGDMQSWELVSLIEAAGRDFVGATMDAGNATWALEDPLHTLEVLGPYALCTGIRDSAVWETADGAAFQWVAMGEGNMDWQRYFQRFAKLCPNVPVILEIISARHFEVPLLHEEFMTAYPKIRQDEFAKFLALAKRGRPLPVPPPDLALNPEFQKSELEKSIRYCREVLGLGLKG